MIPEKNGMETARVFFELLLIGELFTPPEYGAEKTSITEILRKCGVTMLSSDITILDQSRIGNSMITIAKYSLDYLQGEVHREKRVSVEGTVTLHTDELGNRLVRFSSRPYPFPLEMNANGSLMSLVSDRT